MIFALRVEDEGKLNARHIGDEDVKSLLVDNIDKNYIKADEPVKSSGSKDYAKLLREHPSFSNEQLCTLQNRIAKYAGCKTVTQPGTLCVRVDGALSVPYGKQHVVEQIYFFCPSRQYVTAKPKWSNVTTPCDIISEDLDHDDVTSWKAKLCGGDSN